MSTAFLRSVWGRSLRVVAGILISLWGFTFGLPEALFIQTVGVSLAILAVANICLIDVLTGRGRTTTAAPRAA